MITTPGATYYLDKVGGGLSSMIDKDGIDWLGFHNAKGSRHKGEYRGFPNAIHKQDGSYFHAMNAGTDPSTSTLGKMTPTHIRISYITDNGLWNGQWDFHPDRCDFTMKQISEGYHYWIQYEGVPGGTMDSTDYWFASGDEHQHLILEPFIGDLPRPEWMAFGDKNSPRTLLMLHHQDGNYPDNYVSRADMTVFAFGREEKNKFLDTEQMFSIGFIESQDYTTISKLVDQWLE